MITDTLWMMGKLKIYFHFSSENLLILIVTHLKSTCVGTAVEVGQQWRSAQGTVTRRAASSVSYY